MNRKKILLLFCCLATTFGFGEEILKPPLKNISAAATNSEQSLEVPLEEMFSGCDTITLQVASKDYVPEIIVYTIEESNFKEVFGSNP